MSASALPIPPVVSGWPLWVRQTGAILRTELRKNFITARGFWIYLLAAAPALIVWMHSIVAIARGSRHGLNGDTETMAGIFQIFFLRPDVRSLPQDDRRRAGGKTRFPRTFPDELRAGKET